MVAPTRTPQARGVKCDLCKKILASATWLDQTKLARNVEDAQQVLSLIKQHNKSECPCIPKSIENLLVGSTHFEIHRLLICYLDTKIHRRQHDHYLSTRKKYIQELSKKKNENINDCHENHKTSRFKADPNFYEQKHYEKLRKQLEHLISAVDFWKIALEDLTHPFNSKLALRLGLTHHVIYACYFFKYYQLLDYQLVTANLLLNLFKSIEGVTVNAILHANYLFIRTLMDCNQYQLARQYLKQATKISNYSDKSHYESILLTCVDCELSLLEADDDVDCDDYGSDTHTILETLATLAVIKPDDKLQHYYARTLAIGIIIKYIHCYQAKSDLCFEFFHLFRYVCAIIRRCYEDSFELVLFEKESKQQQKAKQMQPEDKQNQISDHSWIKFAVCGFAFTTFDLLTNFYVRSGQPETLELLYNGLNLVAYRSGSCYWQTKLASIGVTLDLLCDKYDQANEKVEIMSRLRNHSHNIHLEDIIQLEHEVSVSSLLDYKGYILEEKTISALFKRIENCQSSIFTRLSEFELYDCKSTSFFKLNNVSCYEDDAFMLTGYMSNLTYRLIKLASSSFLSARAQDKMITLIASLGNQLKSGPKILEFYNNQILLETLLIHIEINQSHQSLLDAVVSSNLFLKSTNDLKHIEAQLSSLAINSNSQKVDVSKKRRPSKSKAKIPQLTRHLRRKGLYDVASRSEEDLSKGTTIRFFDTIETIKNFSSLTKEEIIVSYLRNSEPNPDYLLYRRAHEILFSIRVRNSDYNSDQLLYHFCEFATATTMRYRWMMFEEQQSSPYDAPTSSRCPNYLKHLGFSGGLVNAEHTLKSFVRSLPEGYNLVQFKYIYDEKCQKEHLLMVSFDNENDPIYVHVDNLVTSDDFFDKMSEDATNLRLPAKMSLRIEDSRKTLIHDNHKSRTEARKKLETDVGIILHDIENEWLGPFRHLLCGRLCDPNYNRFISTMIKDILSIMEEDTCKSKAALKSMLKNAPLISRDEFCQSISSIFGCPDMSEKTRDCFNLWIKSMETFVKKQGSNLNKLSYLQTLTRGQLGLVLEKELEHIPFESLPVARITKGGIFRVPSLRIFHIIATRSGHVNKVDSNSAAYLLDPANNLGKTKERFEDKLKAQTTWHGTIGQPPKIDQLEQWLTTEQIYLFIGHGAGTTYYNQLCKGRGLSAMVSVRPVAIVMGCSSGRVLAEGPKLDSFGISWVFVFRGSPSYVGLLWDVTDTDIDRFLDSFLAHWIGSKWQRLAEDGDVGNQSLPITQALSQARHVCQSKFLVGSTPVVYGIPMWSK